MENSITSDEVLTLQKELTDVLKIIENETVDKYPTFYSYLNLMKRNVEICIECNFDGINDLYKYLREDWRAVFTENAGILKWKINKEDIDDKAFYNGSFFSKIEKIDEILQANMYVKNEWIDRTIIKKLATSFTASRKSWETLIALINNEGYFTKSKLDEIPDDIWSYGRRSGITGSDEALSEWFRSEIPAFYNSKPTDLVKFPYGEDALRELMMTLPT